MVLVMPKLPEEIVADILSRLPVKILTRFKCVSKPWLSLISDPQFTKLQLKQARAAAAATHNTTTNHKRLFLATCPLRSVDFEAFSNASDPVFKEHDYPAKKAPGCNVQLVGTCDGLICLVFDYKDLILWNPSTRVSMELTAPDDLPDHQDTIFCGFGYDNSSDGYKVIRGVSYISSNGLKETEVQVLTMKKNSCRKIMYADLSSVSINGMGILSNNALHWLVIKLENDFNKYYYSIVSFDLSGERFEEVGIPDHIDRKWCVSLGTMGDSLVMICRPGGTHFESWAMKSKSWTRLFRVSGDTFPGFDYMLSLVCFTKEGKVVLDIDGWELILYSPEEERIKDFMIKDDWGMFGSIVYEESLVSPNGSGHDEPSRIQ